jgi:hypothetical protein
MNAKTLAILIAGLSLVPLAACERNKDQATRMSEATNPPPAAAPSPPPATAPSTPPDDRATNPPLPSGTPLPAPETPGRTPEPPRNPQ